MANNILREFFVAIGFKVDEAAYRKQRDTVDRVDKQLGDFDKHERSRAEAEAKRIAERRRNIEGLGLAVAGLAAAATAAAAVVATAVAKMTGGFDQFYFISQRTGASVNNIRAMGYAFSQVGSSAESATQAIEAFARTRRTNPGINGLLRSYGVDTRGDSADVLTRSIEAIQNRHPYYTGAQVAGLLGITEDQFKTFTTYREEIKKFREEYARTQTAFGVNSDQTSRAAASVTKSVNSLVMMLGVLTEKIYMAVAPALERVVKGIKDWIEANPEKVEAIMKGIAEALEGVGKALIAVGNWFADDENRKRFVDFWSNAADLVKNVTRLIGYLLDSMFNLSNFLQNSPLGKILTFNPVRDYIFGSSAPGGGGGQGDLGVGSIGSGRYLEEGGGAGKPGIIRRGWNRVKSALGFGGDDKGQFTSSPPEAAGKYRPQRTLTERDLSDAVVNTIAGEARLKSPGGADAVINNMFNRLGTKGWGPSRDLQDVARAPGQYEGYRRASASEAAFIRDRIKAIASGGVPDNTGGANSFRASWYRGPWWRRFGQYGKDVAGNTFAYDSSIPNGPYAPYKQPKSDPQPSTSNRPSTTMSSSPLNLGDYLRSSPMGSSSMSNDNSKTVTQNNPVTVNVSGAMDPAATGAAVGRAVGQAQDMSLRNVQTAIR